MTMTTLPKSPYLNMNDFNSLYKYKLILPIIYILCGIGAIFGPLYFGNIYSILTTSICALGIIKLASMTVATAIYFIKNTILIEKVKRTSNG